MVQFYAVVNWFELPYLEEVVFGLSEGGRHAIVDEHGSLINDGQGGELSGRVHQGVDSGCGHGGAETSNNDFILVLNVL